MIKPSTSVFALLQDLCGLSAAEAAEYLGVSLNTVQSVRRGVFKPRPDALHALASLFVQLETGVAASSLPPGALRRRKAIEEVRKLEGRL